MEEKNTSFEITTAGENYIKGEDGSTIYINIDDAEPALDFNLTGTTNTIDLNTIDLSGLTSNITISSAPYTTTGPASYQYSNVASSGSFSIGGMSWDDTTRTTDVIISTGNNQPGVKLLATLNLWSEILGLPLVREDKFNSPILEEIQSSWIEAAKQGKIKQCKKFKEQFDIIEKLTKDEKKDNE
jgi:hypothetical protein